MLRILITGNTNDSHRLLSDVAVERTGSDLLFSALRTFKTAKEPVSSTAMADSPAL